MWIYNFIISQCEIYYISTPLFLYSIVFFPESNLNCNPKEMDFPHFHSLVNFCIRFDFMYLWGWLQNIYKQKGMKRHSYHVLQMLQSDIWLFVREETTIYIIILVVACNNKSANVPCWFPKDCFITCAQQVQYLSAHRNRAKELLLISTYESAWQERFCGCNILTHIKRQQDRKHLFK